MEYDPVGGRRSSYGSSARPVAVGGAEGANGEAGAPEGVGPGGRPGPPGRGAGCRSAASARGAPAVTGAGAPFCRGRNHSPVDSASVGAAGLSCHSGGRFAGVLLGAPASTTPSTGEEGAAERCRGPAGSAGSALFTGLRTTTGGIGREPGMLIRILVVRVVSVFGTSSASAGWAAGG
ncbi:hypothetical protein ACFQ0T_15795 [Kitasatospora gansuensis]